MKKLAMLLVVCLLFQVIGFAAYADQNDPADVSDPAESVSDVISDPEEAGEEAGFPAEEGETVDETDGEEPAGEVDGEEPVGEVDGEEPAGEVDGEEPAEVVDGEEPAEVVDGEEPAEVVDGEEPADEVDGEEADDEEIEGEEVDEELSEEELENKDAETAIEDFLWDSSNTVILRYKGSAATVTIPNQATRINEAAFAENTTLKQVQIPETVTEIGIEAFRGCTSLVAVNIPSTVTEIQNGTFAGCTSLPAITLHNGITRIGDSAFEGCVGFAGLTLPSSLTEIGRHAFDGCVNIGDLVEFPDGLTTIGEGAFAACSKVKEIVLPDSVTEIGVGAFDGCTALSTMTLPAGITQIQNFTFRNCEGLTRVVVPDGVTSIGREAFYGCKNLSYVELPASVDVIQTRAFIGIAPNAIIYIDADPGPSLIDENSIEKGCTIYGHVGSGSEKFANANGYRFIPIELMNFVKDCYTKILNRNGDQEGIIAQVELLYAKGVTAAEMVSSFIKSDEFKARQLSDDEVVDVIYDIMTNQAPDYDGKKADWLNALDIGVSYDYVIKGFSELADFKDLCENTYNIVPGTVTLTENRDKNLEVTAFVQRCYQIMMKRRGDVGGLNAYTGALLSRNMTGAQLMDGFANSTEFTYQKLNTEDTVEVLYNVMLNRESDAAGKATWVSLLDDSHVSLHYIVNAFADSVEFKNLCYEYVIAPGAITLTEPRDQNLGVTQFVTRCYTKALKREPDVGGLNAWTSAILSKARTPEQVAWGFVFSKECKDMRLSNENFVKMLYNLYMGRDAEPAGLNVWTSALDSGMTRENAVKSFAACQEFQNIVASYGLR